MPHEMSPGKPTTRRYSGAEKERAVRAVLQLRKELGAEQGTIKRVAVQLGIGTESLRGWVKQAEIDGRVKSGVTSAETARVRELEQENRELRRANAILRSSAAFFAEMKAAAIPISASQIGRILAADDVKPHRVQGWLTRRDSPEFWERAADVCGLYLAPPADAVVLSIDETTGLQAKSRKHPTRPVRPGRPERREFEYVRHGTASLIAALDVATGKVTATDVARNNSVHFIEFLTQIEESIDPALAIHVVLDNGSSHRSKATKK